MTVSWRGKMTWETEGYPYFGTPKNGPMYLASKKPVSVSFISIKLSLVHFVWGRIVWFAVREWPYNPHSR